MHYDTRDGLAGSTVYDLTQDKDGFIWFATDAGVSRYDGTRFKNFTTSDGLPESEVLKIFADSKGRIWIAPFKNTICYYYKGKIYTSENDSLLNTIKLTAAVANIAEDCTGSLLFLCSDRKVFELSGTSGHFFHAAVKPTIAIGRHFSNRPGFEIATLDSHYYHYQNNKLEPSKRALFDPTKYVITYAAIDSFIAVAIPPGILSHDYEVTPTHMSIIFSNTVSGSWLVDTTRFNRYAEQLLKGKQVSHGLIDREKNIWLSTLGEGVYKLVSREFKNWHFKASKTAEVFSIEKHNDQIVAGMGLGWVYSLSDNKHVDSINFNQHLTGPSEYSYPNRVLSIKQLRNGDLIMGMDGLLVKRSVSSYLAQSVRPIKSIEEIDSSSLLLSTGFNVLIVDPKDLTVKDTIWHSRSTSASLYNNDYYIGTTNGLLIVGKDQSLQLKGDSIPCLRHRISGFAKSTDGTIWIATNGAGLVQMSGRRVVRNITTKNGLVSDLCRTVFLNGHLLWVGTDKGVSKVDLSHPDRPFTNYSTLDGLPSNIINAIYVDSGKVYIGSPAGLTSFDESKVFNHSRCDLQLLDVSVSGQSLPIQKEYTLSHSNNNFRVEFVGISFKSGGNVLYRYRLKGLKDEWDSTRQNVLEYPSLPSGGYQLEIMAINKFGVESGTITIPFLIETPYWQTWWFQLLVVLLVIAGTALIVSFRFNQLRKREREKAQLQQKIHDLEQLALRSQMNPHFIFNCLNSIQNFIINRDLEATNQYLTEFAYLIRQTLDNADKGVISINQEIQYLTRYIDLERMRFDNSFDYVIDADATIDQEMVYIPSMILQPYVENAIRHGVRYKKDRHGLIQVLFRQESDALLCIVEDNGIGRAETQKLKSSIHVEYQSKGMSLTAARIDALNRQYGEAVSIEVIDLASPDGQPAGTRIVIRFPFKMLTKIS